MAEHPHDRSLDSSHERGGDPRPSRRNRARLVGLFLLGLFLLNPPLLGVFRTAETVAGVPPLLLYLFGVWALIVVAIALVVERRKG